MSLLRTHSGPPESNQVACIAIRPSSFTPGLRENRLLALIDAHFSLYRGIQFELSATSREHVTVIDEALGLLSKHKKDAIMPPHPLHPRSRMTSSLFATTVVASFFVVGLPHLLPCPAPRVTYADGDIVVGEDGRRRRRKRRENPEIKDGIVNFDQVGDEETLQAREERLRRECPVPKPGGILGEWLGFHGPSKEAQAAPRVVR